MSLVQPDSTLDLLADVAADFALPDAERVRAGRDAGGRLDREMWGRIAANGWIGIAVPEAAGGAGLGPRAVSVVARRLGYAGFPEPFVAAAVLAPELLAVAAGAELAAGDEDVAARSVAASDLLARALEGDAVLAVAWQGARGGLGPESVGVTVADQGLDGSARFLGLADADFFLVAARAEGGISVHLVEAGAEGLTTTEERRADGGADLRLDLAGVAGGAPLIDADAGAAALAAALDSARLAAAAELVGLTERVIELTLEYLSQRKQFGKPIGAQQALQHRMVDAWIQGRLAAAALEAAVSVHESEAGADARARAAASSSAKARAAAAARQVSNEALQLHGAIGFTDEYELGLYINRALALAPWLGGAAEHRRRYAELVPIGPGEGR